MWRILDMIALILLILGGIDLGLVGVFDVDYIVWLFSDNLVIAHSLFLLIGLAAIYLCFRLGHLISSLQPPA